jgi:hypothetical protein
MIDNGLPPKWDPDIVHAIAKFDQGDIVERPPFFYAAVPSRGVWSTTTLLADQVGEGEDVVIEVDPQDRPPYGVITSQGCDVLDISRKPWVQVAPVFEATVILGDERRLADVRRDAVPHLALLDPPRLEGLWVADLRIEMPIEKSWLAERAPIAGFADAEGRHHFAQRLAGRLERPALPDEIHQIVVRPLRRWLDRVGVHMSHALAEAGVEFRLSVQEFSGQTYECRLLVVGRRTEVPSQVVEALEKWWRRFASLDDSRVHVLGPRYCSSEELNAREYLSSVLLDDRFLGPDADVA